VTTPHTGNLPAQPTPFIGRAEELRELKRLLSDPSCRLVTLVGHGGSGKTRLSIQAASESVGEFEDGAWFVPLQPVSETEYVVPAIAGALGFTLRGQEEPKVQLFGYLSSREILLLLDNFEHVVEAADLVSEMLQAAPRLKALVTTREALSLGEEWVFPVRGLTFPEGNGAGAEKYDAVRLFVERARRVSRDYSPEGDWEAIARLCRLVQGIPLAVELAASWIKVLPCREIVSEVERNLDFLDTRLRNVPERHRSVRAVFEESWTLLRKQERSVFARLSVFRGSFGREAAEKVAGASLAALSTLLDKSLLKPHPSGRYSVHEMLRQYAFERLSESPEEVALTADAHWAYYWDFVLKRTPDLLGHRQVEASAEIEAEMDNLRSAWQWAVEQVKTENMGVVTHALGQAWQFKSRYVEAAGQLDLAQKRLEEVEPTKDVELALAAVLVQCAWFHLRLGRVEEAAKAVAQSRDIYERLETGPVQGFATDPRSTAGVIATIKGDYAEAARLGEEARKAAAQAGPEGLWNLALAYYVLARSALLQGEYESAAAYAGKAAEAAEAKGDRWFLAYCFIEMGNVASARGDLEAAREHYQASYDLRKEFEDPEGMAIALTYLGEAAVRQERHQEALLLYQQAISTYREIQDIGGLAQSLFGMGKAAAALGEREPACDYFREALESAVVVQHVPLILTILLSIGEMQLRSGDDEESAMPLLSFALHHPSSDHETKSQARALASDAGGELPPASVGVAMAALQRCLTLPTDLGIGSLLEAAAERAGEGQAREAYPDGLTEREVEVLRLVARGMSNQQIADELYITSNTVANHVKNILSKTQSRNRTEAASYAMERQLA
jgi:predicted ATPase/DNA-binding CsgD family transcriptional regulator